MEEKNEGGGLTSKTCNLPRMYPWPCDSLDVPKKGYGLGNPLDTNLKTMAEPWREQLGFFVFTRDAVTGDLVLAGDSNVAFMTTGEDEPPPSNIPLPFVNTLAWTNNYAKGAPTPRDMLFAAIALAVEIGRPIGLRKNELGAYTNVLRFDPWLDQYGQRMRDLLYFHLGMQVIYRDQSCNFELGGVRNYPPLAGIRGGDYTTTGSGFGVAAKIPVCRGPIYFGAQDESNQARILMTSPAEDIILGSDGLARTVEDVAVPVFLTALGDAGPWCGPCAPSEEEISAQVDKRVAAQMSAMESRLAAMIAAQGKR